MMIDNMTLQDAYTSFLKSRDAFCSDATVRNYSFTLSYFINFITDKYEKNPDEILVNEIVLDDLNDYSIYLKTKIKNSSNPYIKSNGVCISSRTRKDYLKDMLVLFNYLYENEYIDTDITKRFKLPKVYSQPLEPLTSEEVQHIDECYDINTYYGSRNLAIIHLLLDEGMRAGEVLKLKRCSLNMAENYIVIKNSKYGKGRILPMSSTAKKYLSAYLDKCSRVDDDIVFTTLNNTPLNNNSLKNLFSRLKKKSGVTRVYPHLLRHTFASSYILGGGSVEMLRVYMGHSDIQTTQNYMHIANEMYFLRSNIYQLDECFLKKIY